MYSAPTRRAALAANTAWGRRWQERYPEAARCVERDLPELLAVFDLPAEHRRIVVGLVVYFNRKYAARVCPAFRKQRHVA